MGSTYADRLKVLKNKERTLSIQLSEVISFMESDGTTPSDVALVNQELNKMIRMADRIKYSIIPSHG